MVKIRKVICVQNGWLIFNYCNTYSGLKLMPAKSLAFATFFQSFMSLQNASVLIFCVTTTILFSRFLHDIHSPVLSREV